MKLYWGDPRAFEPRPQHHCFVFLLARQQNVASRVATIDCMMVSIRDCTLILDLLIRSGSTVQLCDGSIRQME